MLTIEDPSLSAFIFTRIGSGVHEVSYSVRTGRDTAVSITVCHGQGSEFECWLGYGISLSP
jgi:hypothetical protein